MGSMLKLVEPLEVRIAIGVSNNYVFFFGQIVQVMLLAILLMMIKFKN